MWKPSRGNRMLISGWIKCLSVCARACVCLSVCSFEPTRGWLSFQKLKPTSCVTTFFNLTCTWNRVIGYWIANAAISIPLFNTCKWISTVCQGGVKRQNIVSQLGQWDQTEIWRRRQAQRGNLRISYRSTVFSTKPWCQRKRSTNSEWCGHSVGTREPWRESERKSGMKRQREQNWGEVCLWATLPGT